MDECINQGSIPCFGYPLVCYSPNGDTELNKGDFWGIMYKSTMMKREKGKQNIIGELLDHYDDF